MLDLALLECYDSLYEKTMLGMMVCEGGLIIVESQCIAN